MQSTLIIYELTYSIDPAVFRRSQGEDKFLVLRLVSLVIREKCEHKMSHSTMSDFSGMARAVAIVKKSRKRDQGVINSVLFMNIQKKQTDVPMICKGRKEQAEVDK